MKFSMGTGGPADKKQKIIAIAAIVIILGAVVVVGRNFIGGSEGPGQAPPGTDVAMVDQKPGGDPTMDPAFHMGNSSAPAGQPAQPGTPAEPSANPAPGPSTAPSTPPQAPEQPAAAAPPSQGAQAPAPAPAPGPAPKPAVAAKPAGPQPAMSKMTVFGTVNVSYPSKWRIKTGAGNMSAIFTDGTASMEVCPPDPKATSAKAIAEAGAKKLKGAIAAQGATRIGGADAYQIQTTTGVRIVGVDASTRVLLVERGQQAKYKGVFDKMHAEMSFGR